MINPSFLGIGLRVSKTLTLFCLQFGKQEKTDIVVSVVDVNVKMKVFVVMKWVMVSNL